MAPGTPLYLAICEDEDPQRAHLQALAQAWVRARGVWARVDAYPDAKALRFAWETDRRLDIALLDIQMAGENGLALAHGLRAADASLEIVFITGLTEFAAEGYEVGALHYLLKPVAEEKLFEVLDRALARRGRREKPLLLTVEDQVVKLAPSEILAVEAVGRHTRVTTRTETFEAREAFGEIAEALDPARFVRCHRSYVVGLAAVRKLTRTDIVLDDGRAIPLSRRMADGVRQAFIRFYKEGD
ncbi:MAG TPA: LytTR family DNA-binding domain-containing protein [Clostridia bacterium]|nr:LytTR family DNA-binding domain-containing protein [Clostridia bacterium]